MFGQGALVQPPRSPHLCPLDFISLKYIIPKCKMSTNWTNCDTPCICSIEKETIPDHLAFFFAIFSCKSPGPFTPSTRNTLDRTRWTSSLTSTVTKSKSSWHYFLGEEVLKKKQVYHIEIQNVNELDKWYTLYILFRKGDPSPTTPLSFLPGPGVSRLERARSPASQFD